MRLLEDDIRDAYIDHLHVLEPNSFLVKEVGIIRGGAARADVLKISEELHGFEIKSEGDSLTRLKKMNQAFWYDQILDRTTAVVSEKFRKSITENVPTHWGITLVLNKEGVPLFEPVREAVSNPRSEDEYANKFNLAHILWAGELKTILKAQGLNKGLSSKAHFNMVTRLASYRTLDEIRVIVIEQLRARMLGFANTNQFFRRKLNTWTPVKQPRTQKV